MFQLFGNEKQQNYWTASSPWVTPSLVAGMTVAIADIKVPEVKTSLLDTAEQEVKSISHVLSWSYYRRTLS